MITPLKRYWPFHLKDIPLRAGLIISFVLFTVVVVSLTGYLSFYSGRQAVNEVADQLRGKIAAQIEHRLEDFLKTPHLINRINADAIRQGLLDVNDPTTLEHYFWEQIQVFETITSIYFGNPQGGLVDAGREGSDGFLYLIATDDFVSGPFKKHATDDQGNRAKLLLTIPNFDARTRPWYTRADETGRAVWSDIYILFTGQDMAIAASRPVYGPKGDLLGVVSNDIFLSHISNYLQSLAIGQTGEAFIIERSGLLVASSTGEAPFTAANSDQPQRRLQASESSIPLVREGVRQLINQFGGLETIDGNRQFEFTMAGQRQLAQVTPFLNEKELDWLIVVVIPEADFMAKVNANARLIMTLILIILGLTIGAGILLSGWVTRPLLHLNQAAKLLAEGKTPHAVPSGQIREISQLTHSFNTMAFRLSQLLENLTAEVAERKQVESDLKDREHFLILLNDITYAALESEDFGQMLQTLADRLGDLIKADGCFLTLWDESSQTVRPAAAYGDLRQSYPLIQPESDEVTMTASVLQAEGTLVAEDVFNTPYISPKIAAMFPTRSMIGLPLMTAGQKLGAALIAFDEPHHFTSAEITYCEQAARQIALAIAQTNTLDSLERRAKEMTVLYELSLEINAQVEVSSLLQLILDRAVELLDTEKGGLWLLRPDGETLELVVEHNQPEEVLGTLLRLGEGLSGRVAQSGQSLILTNYQQWEGKAAPQPIARVVGVPLILGDRVVGVLNVFDAEKTGAFSDNQVQLLNLFATQAAIALEKVRLFESLQESESRYRTLFEQANDAILLTTESDEIIDVNRRGCELWGYSRQELLTMKVSDLQPSEALGLVGNIIKQELEQYGGTPFETVDMHRDGRRIPVEVSVSMVTGQEDRRLALCIVRDISERKQAEEALRQNEIRYRAIVEDQTELIARSTPERILTFVNAAYSRFFGLSPEELIGQDFMQLDPAGKPSSSTCQTGQPDSGNSGSQWGVPGT